jgi:hypothetical protein
MILKYKIHYKFYCVVYSIIIYLLYTNTRLGRLWAHFKGLYFTQNLENKKLGNIIFEI